MVSSSTAPSKYSQSNYSSAIPTTPAAAATAAPTTPAPAVGATAKALLDELPLALPDGAGAPELAEGAATVIPASLAIMPASPVLTE